VKTYSRAERRGGQVPGHFARKTSTAVLLVYWFKYQLR
jgi:hypothetical protein